MIASCQIQKTQEADDSLKTQVLAIHDEAMEKMDVIMKLQMQLLKRKDSANASQIEEAFKSLDDAHENMMAWMHNFSIRFPHAVLKGANQHGNHTEHGGMDHGDGGMSESMKPEEEEALLKTEKEKVIALRDEMDESIEMAKALLE